MSLKHVFIINPKAGKHDCSEELTERISKVMLEVPYEIIITKSVGHATEVVAALCKDTDTEYRVYACGGDGTLNEVINGFYYGGCPAHVSIGCIPTGSGNDFIKSFKCEKSDYMDIARMSNGSCVPIDLLTVNGRASVNIISVGFDANVCDRMVSYKTLPLVSGSAAYKMAVAYCLLTRMKYRLELYADGEKINDRSNEYLFVIAANGRYYGGGFMASPGSDMQDGLIDFLRISTVNRLDFAALVGKFKRGDHKDIKQLTSVRCKTLKICSPSPVMVNIDGEITKMSNPEIKIIRSAVKIILPVDHISKGI